MSFGGGMSTVIWLSDQQQLREEFAFLFSYSDLILSPYVLPDSFIE
jgi:hypothetical protein